MQRQQYIVQESDNSLYGRANIKIKSIMVGKEDDGQEFALYVIEVQRKAGENMSAASWLWREGTASFTTYISVSETYIPQYATSTFQDAAWS